MCIYSFLFYEYTEIKSEIQRRRTSHYRLHGIAVSFRLEIAAFVPYHDSTSLSITLGSIKTLYLQNKPQIYPSTRQVIRYTIYGIGEVFDEYIRDGIIYLQQIKDL